MKRPVYASCLTLIPIIFQEFEVNAAVFIINVCVCVCVCVILKQGKSQTKILSQ